MSNPHPQNPSSQPTRRDLLKGAATAGVVALATGKPLGLTLACGSAGPPLQERIIPADKRLGAEYLAGLKTRGERRTYRGEDRKTIGMPCGGIGAGQLYVLGDGRLGCWQIDGILNFSGYGAENYRTYRPPQPIEQGFAVAVREAGGRTSAATLDDDGYDAIEFVGEYPVAQIAYRAREKSVPPVEVDLETFSPFVPLDARASSFPATVMRFSLHNRGAARVEVAIGGWLQNMTFRECGEPITLRHRNRVVHAEGLTAVCLETVARSPAAPEGPPARRVLADFESGSYDGWTVTGDAFGDAPAAGRIGNQQEVSGFGGKRLVNSYAGGDAPQGRMLSAAFTIDLPYLSFKIGGGKHAGQTCINLLVGDKPVRTATGRDREMLETRVWDVSEFEGKQARIEIVDTHTRGWGHVNIDDIVLSNTFPEDYREFEETALSFGEMALSLVGEGAASADRPDQLQFIESLAGSSDGSAPAEAERAFETPLVGSVVSRFALEPGQCREVTFVVSWYFPNLHTNHGVMYANWFAGAVDVARQLAADLDRLRAQTQLFLETYYEQTTLPRWLIDRLMMPLSTLATGTSQWWKNGRFWGWEGVGCCWGTCTHVWNYAQGEAFLFPELARSTRTMQDLGEGFDEQTGLVGFRSNRAYAADGQAGTILKCYREHRNARDGTFLRENWPRIRKALDYLISQDGNADGIIENAQHNTYDINFVGPNTFVGSLYLAALRAGEEMARSADDAGSAERYRRVFEAGSAWSARELFNGEYFEQRIPADASTDWQYGSGCLSDQCFGQTWAHVLGLGYIYPPDQVRKALQAVFRYNWAPDVGPYNAAHNPERWFARPGDGGLFTCTWPRGQRMKEPVRYRDEVWTGIEYQAAAGLAWEGLVDEALAIVAAIDRRYAGANHNPWNEVECGDHYARALASWGVLLALAGYRYDGPGGVLEFSPKLRTDDFACFFSTAGGWGLIAQQRERGRQVNRVHVRWGELTLNALRVESDGAAVKVAGAALVSDVPAGAEMHVPFEPSIDGTAVTVRLPRAVRISAGQHLEVELHT